MTTTSRACFTHPNTAEWETPPEVFEPLHSEFKFTVDVCATAGNAKCERYFTVDEDGLTQTWRGESCWMNPPYGRAIKSWMRKAHNESLQGATVVCLVPARTDTAWWWDYAMKGEIRFIRGRVRFLGGEKANPHSHNAPFPCAVVIFRPLREEQLNG